MRCRRAGACLRLMGVFLFCASLAVPALATDATDITSGLNTLPLLTTKITGDTVMAIVYDPADAASAADATNIKKAIEAGIKMPDGSKLTPLLVGVNETGKLSRARIAFLTTGVAPHYASINTATSAASILTMTTDVNCVRAAQCIIGVEAKPSLTIYYSKQAADNAKIEFTQAFSMVVKQP